MVALTASEIRSTLNLRRCILTQLYNWFREYPRAAIELKQIGDTCKATAKALNWNIAYLEKKGWIELDTSAECAPYIACTAVITGTGIDLVEDAQTFEKQFGADR